MILIIMGLDRSEVKVKRIFLLRCPKCKNLMKYHTYGNLGRKRKRCVYCGYSFQVKKAIVDLKGLKNKNF